MRTSRKRFYSHLLKHPFAREYGKDGVIDIACGTGAVLLHFAEHGIYVDGTDLSEAMCRVAAEKAKNKDFDLNISPRT